MNRLEIPKYVRYAYGISAGMAALTLFLVAYLGTFSRMIADDYCSAWRGLHYGPLQGVALRYQTWASNYSNFFIKYALAPLQPAVHSVMTIISIVGLVSTFAYFFYQLARWRQLPQSKLFAGLLSLFATFVLVVTAPTPQHNYWFAAVIPYVWSLVILIAFLGSIVHFLQEPRSNAAHIGFAIYVVLVVLLLSGFIETIITLLIAIFGFMVLALPVIPSHRQRDILVIVVPGLIAAGVGLVIVLSSPGIAVRQAAIAEQFGADPLSKIEAVLRSLYFALVFLFVDTFGVAHVLFLFFAIIFGGYILYGNGKLEVHNTSIKPGQAAVLVTIVGYLLIAASMVPAVIGQGFPAQRPLILPRLIQIVITVAYSYLALISLLRHQHKFRRNSRKAFPGLIGIIALMLIFIPALALGRNIALLPDFQTYAQSWDARHAFILQEREEQNNRGALFVQPLAYALEDYFVLEQISEDHNGVNACAANYYQVESVSLRATEP